MLTEQAEAPAATALSRRSRPRPARARDGASSKRCSARPSGPFAILGGSRWSERGGRGLRSGRPKRWALPVGCSFRRQMLFDHLHPNYAGDVGIGPNPALANGDQGGRPRAAGRRPLRRDAVVGLHAAEQPLSATRRWSMSIPTPANSAASTARRCHQRRPRGLRAGLRRAQACAAPPAWAERTPTLHEAYLAWSTPPETGPGAVQMGPIMAYLESVLPEDAISDQRRRQLRDLDAPLPPLPPLRHAGRADLGLDGLRHAGRRRRQGAVSASATSSPLPATAAS